MKSLKLLPLLVVFATLSNLQATSLTYNGGISGSWTNGGSGWLDGITPASWNNATPDAAIFTSASAGTVNVDGGVTVGNITNSSGTYSLAGSGTLTLSSTTWDVASGLTNTVSTALGGTTGLTKSGSGVLLFSGANKNFTGSVTINGGAIQIASAAAGALGTNTTTGVTLNGGALYTLFSASSTVNYAITVGASGGELRNLGGDGGRFTLAGNKLNGSGVLTLSFGTSNTRFILGGTAGTTQTNFTGKWVVDSGNNVNRFVDVYSALNFGNVSGDDAITLKNTGTLLLRGGTYQTNGSGADIGITIGAGGGKINGGGNTNTVLATKLSGEAGNTLTLGVETGTVLVLSNTSNSYLGETAITANAGSTGVVRLGLAGVIPDAGGTVTVGTNTTLDLNGVSETIGGLAGTGTVNSSSGTGVLAVGGNNSNSTFSGVLANGAGTLALTKVGTGNLTLSTSNSFSGGTTVQAGRLTVANANALGSGNVLVQSVSANTATLSLSNATVSGKTVTLDSTSAKAILLSTAGASTWNGTNTLAGGAGALQNVEFTTEGSAPLTVSGTVNGSIGNGKNLTLRGIGTTNVLSAAVNIGSTPLAKTDTGTWRITSSSNTWGTTTISVGTLEVGATDALPDASNLTMAASTKLDLLSAYSDSVGTLTLSGNATIDFGLTAGTAQALAFSNSSAISWSTFTLTINGYESGSDALRFGTSSAGLSVGQLASINFTGFDPGAVIDVNGYVTPVPEPSTYALLGMGAVACWGYVLRRRRR